MARSTTPRRDRHPTDLPDDTPVAVASARFLPGAFIFKHRREPSALTTAIDETAPDPVGPLYVWERPCGAQVAVYENARYAADGYPYTAARRIDPVDGDPYWKHTAIGETWPDAIEAAERTADHIAFLAESEPGERYAEWVARTGGTAFEHDA